MFRAHKKAICNDKPEGQLDVRLGVSDSWVALIPKTLLAAAGDLVAGKVVCLCRQSLVNLANTRLDLRPKAAQHSGTVQSLNEREVADLMGSSLLLAVSTMARLSAKARRELQQHHLKTASEFQP